MSENFDEVERKPKSGRRLVRDELFKIIFEVEADENSKERIKVIYDQYIVRDEELRPKLNGEELAFIEKYISGIQEKNEKTKWAKLLKFLTDLWLEALTKIMKEILLWT